MHIVISGASGLIGGALTASLEGDGHRVVRLVRREPAADVERSWDPDGVGLDPAVLSGADAVVHLAAESIAGGRWTDRRMGRIRQSREQGTRVVAEALAAAEAPPPVFLCASAIGFYGDRPGETLTEDSAVGTGFLSEVCQVWEGACAPAQDAGARVAQLRFGLVLSPRGGALKQLITPFRLGVGGRLGSGRQHMSWISLDDTIAAVRRVLEDAALRGPVNIVSPAPVTNREFTRVLGRVLRRPTLFPAPRAALRLALGRMAGPLLFSDQRVLPHKLQQSGFLFRHPTLDQALRHLLVG